MSKHSLIARLIPFDLQDEEKFISLPITREFYWTKFVVSLEYKRKQKLIPWK